MRLQPEQKARLPANFASAPSRRAGFLIGIPRELIPDSIGCRLGQADRGQCGNDIGWQILGAGHRLSDRERSISKQPSDEGPDNARVVTYEVRLTFQPLKSHKISIGLAEGRRAAGYRFCHGSSLSAGVFIGMNKHNESYWKQNFARNTMRHLFDGAPGAMTGAMRSGNGRNADVRLRQMSERRRWQK